jgi:hypothetical protein
MSALHSYNQWLIVAAVALHVAAIAFYQGYLKADLIGPMIHGKAEDHGARAPRLASVWLAAALFAIACAAVYYLVVVYPRPPA